MQLAYSDCSSSPEAYRGNSAMSPICQPSPRVLQQIRAKDRVHDKVYIKS